MDLNREVAEKCMGWEPYEIPHSWNPLEDLNQCFEVVERLNKDRHLELRLDNCGHVWIAWFYDSDNNVSAYNNSGKTPNESILKAAREAVNEP